VRVGGARPPPLITFTLTSKVAVYAPAEWEDTLTLFHLYQYMYSVGDALQQFPHVLETVLSEKKVICGLRIHTTNMPKK
jgi:hypothetical protein